MKRFVWLGLLAGLMYIVSITLVLAQETTPPVALETNTPVATIAPFTPTPLPKPAPISVLPDGNATLEVYFATMIQGQSGLLHVYGAGVAGARARFQNRLIEFFPDPGDGFYGLLSVTMDQRPRDYELSVFVWYEDGTRTSINTQVNVAQGSFIRQDFIIPPERAYLIDPEIERAELARVESIFSSFTAERLWDDNGFQMPIFSEITSPFGAYRILNSTVETRHTGWDLRAPVGTPVMASATGRVAFAGPIDIRGNFVAIDHGYGIYSTYSHLSQIHVTRGQSVVKGQIIGVSGDTGRSNGPHLHWEIAVNGTWVDSVAFLQTWIP